VTAAVARPARSPDWPLLVTVLVLGAGTVALFAQPDLRFLVVAPGLDLVITTVATLAATGVSALAWTRYQLQGGPASALQAAAFAVLAAAGFLFLAAIVTGLDGGVGLNLTNPTQAPVYILLTARLIAGGLLLAGAWLERTGRRLRPVLARRTVLFWLIVFLAIAAIAMRAADALPELVSAKALATLTANPSNAEALSGATTLGSVLQLVAAGLFLAAAVMHRDLERAGTRPRVGYLSIGLVIAGFSQLHAALHPGGYTTLVTTGDVLRLAFYLVLLVGVAAEVRRDLRDLQSANAELARMRESDVVRATLEERGRLAREIHDGLAQDLWYAKLKQARVAQAGGLDDATRITANEVLAAIDTALGDARQAVSALREGTSPGAGLVDVVRDSYDDFTERFGLGGTFECDTDLPPISARGQAEALRIVQEALNNVSKHADATVVRLRLERSGAGVRISITDNGRGFDPADVPADRFGLRTMRERAEMIGARLTIDSEASGGTAVVVDVPGSGAVA
jgi:signal transduction histidine kinase